MRTPGAIVVAGMLAGCTVLGLADEDVHVRLEAAQLVVENDRTSPIHYIAIGENSLILWAPCVRPDCPRIEAGVTERISLDEVPAGTESAVIRFHWWVRRGSGDDARPGPVHTIELSR